jgi:osmotically inducible protein OsmC
MNRKAHAHWSGNLKSGQGTINTESQTLKNINYSFNKRFGNEPGTNPEELIAAAHSGCFSMAFSAELEKAGFTAEKIDTEASVSLENVSGNWTINKINLNVSAEVPGATEDQIRNCAETAKKNCPVSRLLNAEISMNMNFPQAKKAA